MEIYLRRRPSAGGAYFEIGEIVVADSGLQYEVGERLNSGYNGVVHVCTDLNNGDELAIKFQLNLSGQRRERFRREVDLLCVARHDHLIQLKDVGSVRSQSRSIEWVKERRKAVKGSEVDLPFVVMELAQQSVADLCKDGVPPAETYLSQFRGLSQGLAAIHEHATHRDLKPSNILVVGERWVISDFGLCSFFDENQAPLTLDGERVGPAEWLSPEAENITLGIKAELTPASDVYVLAMIFWYIATGNRPDDSPSLSKWLGPDRLFLPLSKALSPNPLDRPLNGGAFADEIEQAIVGSR